MFCSCVRISGGHPSKPVLFAAAMRKENNPLRARVSALQLAGFCIIIYHSRLRVAQAAICRTGRKACAVWHAEGGPCAMGHHEPCQAGNRAALSGMLCAPQASCPLHAKRHTGRFRMRLWPCPFFIAVFERGGAYVPRAVPQMAAQDVF